MKPMRMHHVGIVLPTLQQAYDFLDRFGLEVDYEGYVKAYKADLIFAKYGSDSSPVELIIPDEDSVLAKYNNGEGGIHHICYEVDDVAAVTAEFEAKGMKMLEKEPVEGTEDIIINFLRPKHSDGILVEFVETIKPINKGYSRDRGNKK
ncbi:MAG: VOC family protein [Clostridiales bacterium]|nr:VOC family protein [Clostridiales bacterium]